MFKIKNKNGFTLIEVMVVIAIIGIMTSISIVSFITSRRNAALEAASREVEAVLREAQNYALSGKNLTDPACVGFNVTTFLEGATLSGYRVVNSCMNISFSLKNRIVFSSGGTIRFLIPHGRLGIAPNVNYFRVSDGVNYYNICVNDAGLITRNFNSACP